MIVVGREKLPLIEDLPETFALLDDGYLIDALPDLGRRQITRLDLDRDSLNIFDRMNYRRAREFAEGCYAASPQGEDTLTVRNGKRAMARILYRAKVRRLDRLRFNASDPGEFEASETLKDMLLSPVLKSFLCNSSETTNFSLDGILLVRLDASLSRFDRFVIANLVASNYPHTVIISDFGQYGHKGHLSLIDEGRLRAGVFYLDEPNDEIVRKRLLLMDKIIPSRVIPEDAETLAGLLSRFPKGTGGYSDDIAAYLS